MATANIRAVITAQDNASKVVSSFGANVGKSGKTIQHSNQATAVSFNQILVATAGLAVVTRGLVGVINDTVNAANKEQAAMTGLTSIAKAFGQSTEKATEAAKDLTKDGLLNIADAARGLKNLLQSGFSLPQAIKLMQRFKDSAAFGKQSALSFGDAVASATEGIKNGNSILVDNAGVTKNLSVILEEAGFSAQDLMRATTDATVRQALFNGIIKETNPQVGDAAKLTELYAGKQAMLSQKTFELKSQIGTALQPVLASLLETITPLVEKFASFAQKNPKLVASILLVTTAGLGLLAVLGSIGLAITALSPIVKIFAGRIALATAGFGALVIAAGFAITKIIQLKNAFDSANRSINNTNKAIDSIDGALDKAKQQYDSGKITKERYNAILRGSYSGLEGRAMGGSVQAGTPYKVGEQGEELFVPNQSGTIIPNNKLGSSGTVNINVNVGMYAGSEMEKRKMATELMKAFKEVSGNNMNWGTA